MTLTRISINTAKAFEKLESRFRFDHRLNAGAAAVRCEVLDKATGKVYASAEGPTEPEAAEAALIAAQGAEKPQTPAQVAQENIRLRARIAELEAKATTPATPKASKKADKSKTAEVKPQGEIETGDDDELTVPEIVMALKTRGLDVPEGDKRTKEWRQAAMEALDEFEKKAAANK